MVVIIYYGREGALICSRHCGIGSCRTGEGCVRSEGFWRSRVIFVVLVTLVFCRFSCGN